MSEERAHYLTGWTDVEGQQHYTCDWCGIETTGTPPELPCEGEQP